MNSDGQVDTNKNKKLFIPKTPQFFKIILDDAVKQGKLMIPRKFVRKYGSELQSPVVFKVPTRAEWKVGFTKCDEDIWLESGLSGFMEYYNIVCGHFLVFTYHRNSNFDVTIFDPTATEIEYPYTPSITDKAFSNTDDESVICLEEISASPKRKYKSRVLSPRRHKTTRIVSIHKTETSSKFHQSSRQGIIPEKVKSVAKQNGEECSYSPLSMQNPVESEITMCLRRASGFTSNNPLLMVTIHPSYVCPGQSLHVPASFIEKQGHVVLCIHDGRTWFARYHEACDNKLNASLCDGWSQFLLNNNIYAGEVCAFELIKAGEILQKIIIFRSKETEKYHATGSFEGSRIPEYLEGSNVFVSRNPLFKKVLPSYITTSGSLHVPFKFFQALVIEQRRTEKNVTLEIGSRSWLVKLIVHSDLSNAWLSRGWVAFAKENLLRSGDLCVFELVNRDDLQFKVYIFRHQSN